MLGLFVHPIWQLLCAITFSVLPLWWLVDRISGDSLTKLLLAVLGNFLFIYLLEFGARFVSAPQWIPLAIVLISMIYSAAHLFGHRKQFAWDGLLGWIGVAVWILGLQSLIVCYGEASWYGDWYEHYERSIWFFYQQPADQRFLFNLWSLAARAPLFNAVSGFWMSSGDDFASYQVYSTVLNTLPFLPLALLIQTQAAYSRSSALIWSMILCGLAPFAVQQETYTWTKFLTTAYLLSGIYLYLTGLKQNRKDFIIFGFVAFAGAILAHYLAILFVIFFACHFLYIAYHERWNPRIIVSVVVISFVLLSTWFVYVFAAFGIRGTLEATSTFGAYGKRQGPPDSVPPWPLVFAGNLVTTTIPYSWRHDWKNTWHGIGIASRLIQRDSRIASGRFTPEDEELDRKSEWMADLVTMPNSLLGCLGYAGLAALLISVLTRHRRQHNRPKIIPGTVFWSVFFVVGIPLNIFASRDYSAIGVAHLNLQPFVLLTAVYLLHSLHFTPRAAKLLLVVFLLESAVITGAWIGIQTRALPISMRPDNTPVVTGKLNADGKYIRNYIYKLQMRATYLSDVLGILRIPFSLLSATIAVSCAVLIRHNQVKFPVGRSKDF